MLASILSTSLRESHALCIVQTLIPLCSLFVGQLIGSSLCSKVFLEYGAREYYALSCGLIGLNLVFCMCRGPLKENKRWVGWGKRDEWTFVKRKAPLQMESTSTAREVEKDAPIEQDLEKALNSAQGKQ